MDRPDVQIRRLEVKGIDEGDGPPVCGGELRRVCDVELGELSEAVQAQHQSLEERSLQRHVGLVDLTKGLIGLCEQKVCPHVHIGNAPEDLDCLLGPSGDKQDVHLDAFRKPDVGRRSGVLPDPLA